LYGFVIPDKGKALIAKAVAGEPLVLSSVWVGSGRVSDGADLSGLSGLVQPECKATSNAPTVSDGVVSMVVEARSDMDGGIAEGFWICEYGVFAIDPDEGEILLYYGTLGDKPQYLSAMEDGFVDVRKYPIKIAVSGDVHVVLSYTPGSAMTAEEVADYINNVVMPDILEQIKESAEGIKEHIDDPMPHTFFGDGAKYKYGMKAKDGIPIFAYTAGGATSEIRIADKDTLDGVNDKIGASGDTANSGGATLFSLLKWIAARFVSFWTDARAALLDRLDDKVSSRASGADYTAARAGKLDNLDAKVSTRAASSTAVSNADYTAARAGKLDKLDYITSTLGNCVKSVQRGIFTVPGGAEIGQPSSGTIAIAPVNPAKSFALLSSMTNNAFVAVWTTGFTDTSLTVVLPSDLGGKVEWQVVEFY